MMTRAVLEQIRVVVPGLNMMSTQAAVITVVGSTAAVSMMVGLSSIIGFPLPFAFDLGKPAWIAAVVVSFGFLFGRKLQHFAMRQNFYLIMLAVIRIAAKNWTSYCLGTKYDLMPQWIIFNVDVLNSMYVSISIQNSKSISVIVLSVVLDAFLAWIAMTDVFKLLCWDVFECPAGGSNALIFVNVNILLIGPLHIAAVKDYYPQLKGGIQFVLLIVNGWILQRTLGIPMLHLLSFVLDHGRILVQTSLFLSIFYAIQNSLFWK
ncbi:hypothetical protein PHYSODRAFT_328146 [Phytophthora sojae]|uniref:Uncharacterized protein n=1 Tax=Phytophthora sojae (strain P6497) TaxID=1094619 RepID=G4Z1X6_PHYSP|nr:hypothetical protein PHYSODRAFT_328146 [Phytophthora sojae]EGZ19974.1 hypothetical protein PHYSODRAFT_328146 [Phytophthora sojae]|eukprot:XP_009522691.1 hypothetical protein PHYSODRAFT_328146 [Phytophthora sojae]